MDNLNGLEAILAGVAALLGASIPIFAFLRLRDAERRSRAVFNKLQFSETQFKYESAVSAHSRQTAVDLAWLSIREIDELEAEDAIDASPTARTHINKLRRLQYRQLEALLDSFDMDRGETDLGKLNALLAERRSEIDTLPGSDEGAASRD
jgi:hypothetical protein